MLSGLWAKELIKDVNQSLILAKRAQQSRQDGSKARSLSEHLASLINSFCKFVHAYATLSDCQAFVMQFVDLRMLLCKIEQTAPAAIVEGERCTFMAAEELFTSLVKDIEAMRTVTPSDLPLTV